MIVTRALSSMRDLLSCVPTPMGNMLPPIMSVKVAILLGFTPGFVILVGAGLNRWDLACAYVLLAVSAFYDSITGREKFVEGMAVGRDELTEEMARSWENEEMTPEEYLIREYEFGPDMPEAARQVARTARRRHRSSRSSS